MKIKRAYIEITNQCNLRCSFCIPHNRTYQFMSLNNFKKVIDSLLPLTSYFYLHVHGEPMMHPQLEQFLDYCDSKQAHVQLVTNGSFLEHYLSIFDHPSLRKLSISVHSIDFQQQDANELLKNITHYINVVKKKDGQYLELRFWTKNQLSKKAIALLSELQSHYNFKSYSSNQFKIDRQVFIHFDEAFEWPSTSQNSKPYGTCLGGKKMMAILVDGTVTPCCLDCRGDIVFGNIFETPINQIISGNQYQSFLNSLSRNKFIEPLCLNCNYRNRFD
ncbi:MAG: radical SAM/SPASM domain-containing protein [Anaerorhabdus sp.]